MDSITISSEGSQLLPKTNQPPSPSYSSSFEDFPDDLIHRQRALKEEGVGQAAFLIRDAVIGHQDAPYEGYYDPYSNEDDKVRNAISVVCGRLVVQCRGFVVLVGWIMFSLSFFEPPHWCRDMTNLDLPEGADVNTNGYGTCEYLLYARGTTADGEEDQQYYPNSISMLLTVSQTQIVELACLIVISMYMLVRFADDGFVPSLFFYPGQKRLRHTVQISVLVSLFAGNLAGGTKLNPLMRMLILGSFLRSFQREFWTFLEMIPQMILVLSILAVIVVFYAWFGVVIFYGTPEGRESFPSLIEGIWTLWICITTANYPDVMMPSYKSNRVTAIFWISFMVISYFYCMNLILSVSLNKYDESIADRSKSREELSKKLLTEAFALLDHGNTNSITRESVMRVMLILNQDIPEIKCLSRDEKHILFAFLDKDGSGEICIEEFLDFGNVLLLKLAKTSDYATFVETYLPSIFHCGLYQKLCQVVDSKYFDNAIDFTLVLNAIIIAIQDYQLLAGEDYEMNAHYNDGSIDTIWEVFETAFTVVYVVEASLKIMVNGWKKYAESPRNVFDLTITILALLATFYVYYPNTFNNSRLIQFVVMVRVLRLGRLIFTVDAFQLFGAVSLDIIPAAIPIFLVLLFFEYAFASLGMALFGGLITRDPTNQNSFKLLLARDFVDNAYWANNFNDMFSGMNVLFNLIVVNNWTECEIGFEYVTGKKYLVRLFFFCFHLIGVIGISNVVTSFIINAFFQQLKTIEQRKGWEEKIDGEAVINGSRAVFDASKVTGTETGVQGTQYYARIQPKHVDVELDERAALRSLFTRTQSGDSQK
ncbi:hypothetical protein ACHAXS_012301 [Conticribra weissflogii]